jgi:large subunit ribosomal protein L37Ae
MARRTKKAGSAGRFGPRYGVRVRRRVSEIEAQGRGRHECPKCRAEAVTRVSTGLWTCKHCGARMASSAYNLTTPVAVRREVKHAPAEEAAPVETPAEEEEPEKA